MKSFFNLVQEVLKPGLCSRCGGCVVLCRAAGFNALGMGEGKPGYKQFERCIECGLCYLVCPETRDLDDEIKAAAAWQTPMGRIVDVTVARPADPAVGADSADGGALVSILARLYDLSFIDSVVLTLPGGRFLFCTDKQQILFLAARKRSFDSIQSIDPAIRGESSRVALVGTPCRMKSFRKMQVMNLVPSHVVALSIGLFCAGQDQDGACRFCPDFSSEFADISLGSTGAPDGWATHIVRTDIGRTVFSQALRDGYLEPLSGTEQTPFASRALGAVRKASSAKKKRARHNRRSLKNRPVTLKV